MVSVFAVRNIKWNIQVRFILWTISKIEGVKNVTIDKDKGSMTLNYLVPGNLSEARAHLRNMGYSEGNSSLKKVLISNAKCYINVLFGKH